MSRLLILSALASALIITAGCASETGGAPQTTQPEGTATLIPAGPSENLSADTDLHLQTAASVAQLDELANQGETTVKLFGVAGGDPAMNGLYTYIAFFEGPAEGWRIFRIGDFLSYRVLANSLGRVDLEVDESVMNDATSEITSRTHRIIVGWTTEPGVLPTSVTSTPAR